MDPPFGLYTTYPRRQIPLQPGTIEDLGLHPDSLLNIESDTVEFDPLVVFREALPAMVWCVSIQIHYID